MNFPEDPSDKTRVDVAARVAHPDSPDGADASQAQRVRGVFDDFSVTQVIAAWPLAPPSPRLRPRYTRAC